MNQEVHLDGASVVLLQRLLQLCGSIRWDLHFARDTRSCRRLHYVPFKQRVEMLSAFSGSAITLLVSLGNAYKPYSATTAFCTGDLALQA